MPAMVTQVGLIATSSRLAMVEGRRQGGVVCRERTNQEDDMGRFQNGVIALTVGAALLGGRVLDASAQDDEGSNEVELPVAAGTLDDGANLLSQAGISIDEAISTAQDA